MITFTTKINVVDSGNYDEVQFYDSNFIRSSTFGTTYVDNPILIDFFKALPAFDIKFDILQKQFKQSGRLVYEYNPFHNLILSEDKVLDYKDQTFYFQTGDICDFNISGSLLPLDLNHPLELEIQPSYDGSVNLIAQDNLNQAILVNSRFSAEELDTYRIIDRKGSNDTNLYEEGYLQPQIKLYKTSNVISQLIIESVEIGGRLYGGSYVFYFKYQDQDGNETDVVAESGIIPVYIGNINDPKSIRGAIANERTDKLIKLKIKHIDKAYDYINLYYVRTTSDYGETSIQNQAKVLEKYIINSNAVVNNEFVITFSGYESEVSTTLDEILQQYNVVDKQKSLVQVQNRLFQANLTQEQKEYKDLEDIALRFFPTVRQRVNIGNLSHKYETPNNNLGLEYFNPLNVSNYLGYWNKEIYRTGIVYIFDNNRLSPVFNTRGGQNIGELNLDEVVDISEYLSKIQTGGNLENTQTVYSNFDFYKSAQPGLPLERLFINTTEDKQVIYSGGNKTNENSAGVFNIMHGVGPITQEGIKPLAIQFSTETSILQYLQTIGVKGFFFVRQKRIPNILFQGMTQGFQMNQEIPQLYTSDYGNNATHRVEYLASREKPSKKIWTTGVKVDNISGAATRLNYENDPINILANKLTSFSARFRDLGFAYTIKSGTVFSQDIALNTELMSDLLVGNSLKYTKCTHRLNNNILQQDHTFVNNLPVSDRHFYNDTYVNELDKNIYDQKVTLVQDGHPVAYSGSRRFRGRAGIQEETFRFESTRQTSINDGPEIPDPDYAVRGLFGTYAGFEGGDILESGTLIDVHVPDFDWENMSNYFQVRQDSFQSYFAITDKYDVAELLKNNTSVIWTTDQYRGDCYVGNYTQRINRNFQDNELPLNDNILGNTINSDVDANSINTTSVWYSSSNTNGIPFIEDNYYLVNRQDVNAVQLGHWMTFKTCANTNLSYRTIDKQHTEEYALTGNYRSFYPFNKISWTSETKIPESTQLNVGYGMNLPLQNYFINPDVPYIQDKFNNRVMFSEIHVNDSFKNGYRIFKGLNYQDYNVGWGSITKILEWRNNLMLVFEHGIGIIPINESQLQASGNNTGDIYVRGAGVLPPTVNAISDTFGSQWKDSITKTSRYVYGVDHVAKKIWRTDGEKIELISDFKIQSFLNDSLTLTSREKTPTVGIRNIKTHWNAFKEDVMFTYYDVDSVIDEKKWNVCFNEQLSRWITRYDWEPVGSENINNIYFSYDRESPEKLQLLASSHYDSPSSAGITVTNYEYLNAENPVYIDPNNAYYNPILVNGQIPIDYRPVLKLKSHVLEPYSAQYYLQANDLDSTGYDNDLFHLTSDNEIVYNSIDALLTQGKYMFSIKIKAILSKGQTVWDSIYDVVHLRLDRYWYVVNEINLEQYDTYYTTRFWKHGQAGIFDYAGIVKPTNWYNKVRPFEFEFVMQDNPGSHKILDNLMIVSNNVEPESFTFSVTTDSYTQQILPYDIAPYGTIKEYTLNRRGLNTSNTQADDYVLTTISDSLVELQQKGLNTWKVGRLFGNMHYKEDFWYIDVAPISLLQKGLETTLQSKGKQSRIKDKQIKIRVRYNGESLAVITQLNSIYTQTYA